VPPVGGRRPPRSLRFSRSIVERVHNDRRWDRGASSLWVAGGSPILARSARTKNPTDKPLSMRLLRASVQSADRLKSNIHDGYGFVNRFVRPTTYLCTNPTGTFRHPIVYFLYQETNKQHICTFLAMVLCINDNRSAGTFPSISSIFLLCGQKSGRIHR
jgi:hypothetical protein